MAVTSAQITVGATPTRVSAAESDSVYGSSLIIRNAGACDVFLGNAGVTTTTGFAVAAGAEYSFDLASGDDLFAIVATGTVTVAVLRTGV